MKKFWSYISNDKYSVGCTGGTVYIYNKEGMEVAKFKDIQYGYNPVISPNGNILIVKSTEGRLAVYSLETMSLIKKFRFSKVDGAQDDGYCFSADGKYFYNVERQGQSTNHAISMYDTTDFKRVRMWLEDDNIIEPSYIEADDDDEIFVLGFIRGEEGVFRCGFVAKLTRTGLESTVEISESVYDYYINFKRLELMGFTEKAKQWSGFKYQGVNMTGMESLKKPLRDLWDNKYNVNAGVQL